ncbi:MAG TPA: Tm-1-like ATP-binding domain-containing protein [Thermoleophilaceae bacterium]|nr:Tm-1-like ATP-binding domain-containing protein [Thermoleophilaceae bacterium]
MKDKPRIALIATLDTKGEEVAYVRDRIRALGAEAMVIDTGVLGEPSGCEPDVSREDVARAAGQELDEVRGAGSRGAAVEQMQVGVQAVIERLWGERAIDGVLCLGGAEGALLGAAAVAGLPVGVPKLIVSPSASGRRPFGPFVGEGDTLVMHSVTDILGINPISRAVFDNAAAAVVGMARDAGRPVESLGERCVGITMLGHTTPAVMRMLPPLEEAGHAPVVFHANGVGGPAMERLIAAGAISGVIDFTLSELANAMHPTGIHATGPSRLTVAGEHGLPQLVVPGCVDFFNQGALSELPERYRDRKRYFHNPVATLVRLTALEEAELGRIVAERLAGARGPVAVLCPTRGFSLADVEGGDLWDPDADRAFIDSLRESLPPSVPFEEVDAHVDDPDFADLTVTRYLSLVKETANAI